MHRPSRCAPDLDGLAARISARGVGLGHPLTILDETSSTNDVAKREAKNGAPHGATFVAEAQTSGRGRQGRAWLAARGESILVSVVLRLACAPSRLPPLSLVAGLAARDAVARAIGAGPGGEPGARPRAALKWPNDVLLDGRKVAGVLVEAQIAGQAVESLVVGVGINVHARSFPDGIAETATSVALHAVAPPDRGAILVDLLEGLDRDLPIAAARGLGLVHARIAAADALRGARVRGEPGEGTAEGVDVEGRLLVRDDGGALSRWVSGEVHLAPSPPPHPRRGR